MQESILPRDVGTSVDAIESSLRTISQNIVVFVFGLLPLLFLPISFISLGYTKTLFVIVGMLIAIVFFSLTVLRSGKIHIGAPWALGAMWLVAGSAIISALSLSNSYCFIIEIFF